MSIRPLVIAAALMCLAAPAAALAPIQNHLNSGRAGERDHAYPLMRCGALYMASLKSAGDDVEPGKAEQVMATAMKMIAIASSFRLKPGDDPERVANGVMDEVESMIGDYAAEGGRAFASASLVKQDFKYCRNFAEPFARNYDMNPPGQPGAAP